MFRMTPAQEEAVFEKMAEARSDPTYIYPWESLEEDLERAGRPTFPIVAYGSLVNASSASQTLKDNSIGGWRPVVAFGVRRLYNYIMPKNVSRYGSTDGAALNVRLTGDTKDMVNGVLIQVRREEIGNLRSREINYDLAPIVFLEWNDADKPPALAYIFSSPDKSRTGETITDNRLEPHRSYHRLCRSGAGDFGEDFLHFWLSTTYLGDGHTPVSEWEPTALSPHGDDS